MDDLKGKTAIVTGGSRGIGADIVRALASNGVKVAFTYHSKPDLAHRLSEECEHKAKAYKLDVSDCGMVKSVIRDMGEFLGGIDILVNNAGISKDVYFGMMSDESWRDVIDVNLNGTYNVTRNVIKKMISKKSGAIVNISSVAGVSGTSGQVNYSASKGGIIALTRALSRETGRYNIRVNCVAPGFIETDMFRAIPHNQKAPILERVSLGKIGEPSDVSNLVLFLASERAKYITGQVIVVDGGMI